jgi:hypothetical protein
MKKLITLSICLSALALTRCCMFPIDGLGVEKELEPIVDSFFAEAKKRGLGNLRPNVLNVRLQSIPGKAQGRTITLTNTILIDPNSEGWKYNREALVYHELGHLILNRDHLNVTHNKYCISIMSNQQDPVYDIYPGEKLYNRRQYYVDELFKPGIATPEWMD